MTQSDLYFGKITLAAVCACVCACACVCGCVCGRKRERDAGKDRDGGRERDQLDKKKSS